MKLQKNVAIHQPNYFPWLGYFKKIVMSDVFVVLDDVQFSKKGGTWTNRVNLLIAKQKKWLTAPVERNFHGTKNINELQFKAGNWRDKSLRTIQQNYGKHPFYQDVIGVLEPLIRNPQDNIAQYNLDAIKAICDYLDFNTDNFVLSSNLNIDKNASELLCELTRATGGSIYLSGDGADSYMEHDVFAKHQIQLKKMEFKHPRYRQINTNEFVSGLSVIDALMNIGNIGVRQLLIQSEHN